MKLKNLDLSKKNFPYNYCNEIRSSFTLDKYSFSECFILSILYIYEREEGERISYKEAKKLINAEIRKINLEKEISFELGTLNYHQIIDSNKYIILEWLSKNREFIFSRILKDEEIRITLGFYLTSCLCFRYFDDEECKRLKRDRFLFINDV